MTNKTLNPNILYPITGVNRTVLLKNIIVNPNIKIGDFTYYDDPDDINNFKKNVLYHFDFIGDQLIIGKFCQIAAGIKFIMNGANHDLNGFSSFPFGIFKEYLPDFELPQTSKGNTVIGNDVWFGYNATIMPGIKIGDGAVIAANSQVTKDIEPYSIVGGNPAKEITKRFDDETIRFLLELKWWDWPIEKIVSNIKFIMNADRKALEKV